MVKKIEESDHYPWSGHSILVGRSKNDWQERGYILGQFNERSGRAIQGYRKFTTMSLQWR